MGEKNRYKKRPCRICRKWFVCDPRLGARQQTCGSAECQRKWHARKCAEWNRKNRDYFQEIYIRKRIEDCEAHNKDRAISSSNASNCFPKTGPPAAPFPPDFPPPGFQEVIGIQQFIIIEYIIRLLTRGVQEAIKAQLVENKKQKATLPPSARSRGDRQKPP